MDFSTFLKVAEPVLDVGLPVLIRGRHGVGKSEVVYMIGESRSLPVVERRASQMTEGDLLGLPDTTDLADGRRATTWNAPDWLVQACTSAVVLFLDEVDRATLEVRQGLFELTDSRKINGWVLHPGTIILAAVNGGTHGHQYQVGEMDPAELDRWTVFDIEPSVEDWLNWAKDRINPLVWDFINHNHAHLEHTDEFEPNKVYPSRRSVERFSRAGELAGIFNENAVDMMQYHLATAFLGFEAAAAFRDFARNYKFAVTVEEIIDKGDMSKVEKWKINEQLAMVEKIAASGRLLNPLDSDNIKNMVSFFHTLDGEVAMKFHVMICNLPEDCINGNGDLVMKLHAGVRDRLLLLIAAHVEEDV
jgi:hypothetical protein|tara:strand:- start:1327 stop:2409 length:1083 start_codon:yes stop_codon:yes gene_type:complete